MKDICNTEGGNFFLNGSVMFILPTVFFFLPLTRDTKLKGARF